MFQPVILGASLRKEFFFKWYPIEPEGLMTNFWTGVGGRLDSVALLTSAQAASCEYTVCMCFIMRCCL